MGNRRSFHIMSNPNRKFRQCSILMLMIVQCCHSVCCAGHKTTQDAEVSLTDSKYNPRRDVYSADTKDAKYGVEYTTAVSNYNMSTFTYPAIANDTHAVRMSVSVNNAVSEYPVEVVIKQQTSIHTLIIPSQDSRTDKQLSYTLCPVNQSAHIDYDGRIDVEISSFSPFPINVTLKAYVILINVGLDSPISMTVTPSSPVFYRYVFHPHEKSVRVKVESNDTLCTIFSIQDGVCPVFDDEKSISFKGHFQTVSEKGAMVIQHTSTSAGAVFIVLLVKHNDLECNGTDISDHVRPLTRYGPPETKERVKHVTLNVVSTVTSVELIIGTVGAMSFFFLIYIAAFVISCISNIRAKAQTAANQDSTALSSERAAIVSGSRRASYGSVHSEPFNPSTAELDRSNDDHVIARSWHGRESPQGEETISADSSSLNEDDIDMLHDIEEDKDMFRTKPFLYVSDLSRKPIKKIRKKYKLFAWNLMIIAIFYGLPVIQLVITYQQVLNNSGNMDLCFYNFFCATPFGVLSAFNNIFSNIGYVMLGFLFLILVKRRDRRYYSMLEQDRRLVHELGIPQHFGLFYALGIALIMEGILSACYHVCPNHSNYQFDTAFMYMIGWLGMLKIYQIRHPDINAHAHTAYFALATVVFFGVIGVFKGTLAFWILFGCLYIVCVFVLSVHLYYMGRWKLDFGVFRRLYLTLRADRFLCCRPTYVDRFVLLLIMNVANWGIVILGLVMYPGIKDFASYLLAIVIINLLMYFAFYIIMKLRCGEKLLLVPLVYTALASVTWGFALYFFMAKNTSWQLTPAMSRNENGDCLLFNFYDGHDVWHALSAISLFLSFMVLLYLDDDVNYKPRHTIPVF